MFGFNKKTIPYDKFDKFSSPIFDHILQGPFDRLVKDEFILYFFFLYDLANHLVATHVNRAESYAQVVSWCYKKYYRNLYESDLFVKVAENRRQHHYGPMVNEYMDSAESKGEKFNFNDVAYPTFKNLEKLAGRVEDGPTFKILAPDEYLVDEYVEKTMLIKMSSIPYMGACLQAIYDMNSKD